MNKPLVGFNVLEQIIERQPERLIPTLVTLLRNATVFLPRKLKQL